MAKRVYTNIMFQQFQKSPAGAIMAELTPRQAAEILSTSHQTIWRRVKDGHLPARRVGIRGYVWIEIDDLREFARRYQYRFNEEVAKRFEGD